MDETPKLAIPGEINNNPESLHAEIGWLRADIKERDTEIANLREANRWIPCSERMPEFGVDVLVFSPRHTVSIAYYYPPKEDGYDAYWCRPHDGKWIAVTHWRPLPEVAE